MSFFRKTFSFATLLLLSGNASAHHAFIAHYNPAATIELEGVISEFNLRNPHSFFIVDVTGEDGEVSTWKIEAASAVHLRRMGIARDTFEVGDKIQVRAWPNRLPEKELVYGIGFVTDSGDAYGKHPNISVASYTSDEQGAGRISGRWTSPIPEKHAESPLPLNAAGLAAVANYDPKLSPANTCETTSIPDLMYAPFYLTAIEIEEDQVSFVHEVYGISRTIKLDAPPALAEPTGALGVATARIDGEELVIETSDYPASRWGLGLAVHTNGAGTDIPSSAQKKTIERFSVSEDSQSLTLEYTLEDPVYLTEPYTGQVVMSRVADDQEIIPFECDVSAASRFSQ